MADGEGGLGGIGEASLSSYAATFVRDAYGRERRGLADRADDSRALGYFDDAGVHAPGAGSAEECLQEASSEGKS